MFLYHRGHRSWEEKQTPSGTDAPEIKRATSLSFSGIGKRLFWENFSKFENRKYPDFKCFYKPNSTPERSVILSVTFWSQFSWNPKITTEKWVSGLNRPNPARGPAGLQKLPETLRTVGGPGPCQQGGHRPARSRPRRRPRLKVSGIQTYHNT